MAYVIKSLYEGYKNLDREYHDDRSDKYFLADSPFYLIGLTIVYYIFVKRLGPWLMSHREPFDLKNIIIVYNLLQVVANAAIFGKALYHLIVENPYEDMGCMMPLRGPELGDIPGREFRLVYAYFVLKIVDFLDTIFFVLRKRYNQVSFLHVYHHILMCLSAYIGMRFLPGGHGTGIGVMNTFVHIIMYMYYFLTAFRPELKNSIWWKKHITQLQLFQFLLIILHFGRGLLHPNCAYPKVLMGFGMAQGVVMIILFSNFYIKAYIVEKQPQLKKEK